MKKALAAIVLPQLDELIAKYDVLSRQTGYSDFSDIDRATASEFVNAAINAIRRAAGPNSDYATQLQVLMQNYYPNLVTLAIPHLGGTLKAVRHAVESGYLASVQELIQANLFADFLEMADHLLAEGYKDPAAVLIGGVLEEHLRKLCDKNNIPTKMADSKGVLRSKKADTMNSDLASNSVYSKGDQKNVIAWLDLRNKAAHGHYGDYTSQQIELLLQSVRDFLTRNPA